MTLSVQSCSREDAEQITGRFREAIGRVEASWHVLVATAIEAFQHRVWVPLGYESWDTYCAAEVDTAAVRIPRDLRIEIVGQMSEAGMSTRAIGSAVGVDHKTVVNDRRAGGEISSPAATPDPVPAPTADTVDMGEGAALDDDEAALYDEPEAPDDVLGFTDPEDDEDDDPALTAEECRALADPDDLDEPEPARITGTDGRSYPATKPSKPRRGSLPQSARSAGWDLRKAVERVERLINDDRFTRNREEVAAQLRGHLDYTVETCQGLLDQLPSA